MAVMTKEFLHKFEASAIQGIKKVKSQNEIQEAIEEIKEAADEIYTNYFLSAEKLNSWILKEQLYFCRDKSTMALFYVRDEYVQVYFWSNNAESLEASLAQITEKLDMPLLVDVIYRDSDEGVAPLFDILNKCGFQKHMSLRRMSMVNKELKTPDIGDIEFAQKKDAQELQDILFQNFDVYGEQIPDIDEIEQAAENQDVIICKKDDVIAAFLWTEHVGKTSIIRYWIARPEFRSAGIGFNVYRQTIKRESSVRRIILWVREDNPTAIRLYTLNGFSFDGMSDDIFLRK